MVSPLGSLRDSRFQIPDFGTAFGSLQDSGYAIPERRGGERESAAVGRAARLGGLIQFIMDVQPLEDELRCAGGRGLAGFAIGELGDRLGGELLGPLAEAGDL